MIRTTTAPLPWPLPWGGAIKTNVLIRAGDVIERGIFEGALAELRAARVFEFQLTEAFDSGLSRLLANAPGDLTRVREIVAASDAGEDLGTDDQAILDVAREQVAEHWRPFKALVAQAARRNELVATLAFQWFVTGWEGVDLDGKPLPLFRAGIDGRVSLDLMAEIPPMMIRLAGLRAYQLLWATGNEKNFVPPSQSDESGRLSTTDTPKKAGSSGRITGRKTRSSRSPKKSSRSSTSGKPAAG